MLVSYFSLVQKKNKLKYDENSNEYINKKIKRFHVF